MPRIDSFLSLVVDQKASDLHLHAENMPMIRHNGDILALPFRQMSDLEARRFVFEIMTEGQRQQLGREQELDFLYELEGVGRFRANVFFQSHGIGAVFRVIPYRLPTLDELRMPRTLKKLSKLQNGLVLVTGPTGSGKTTTLAAMINEINRTSQRHVIVVEDPIEFVHEPVKSVITQRQIGEHTESFADALRAALREAPDVLVVGELRDVETISLALAAAETGVLVIGTLHTSSAANSVNRIIDAMPAETRDQVRGVLSVLLRGVVAQRLCKRADGDGRAAMLEILVQNFAVSHMIREGKTHQIEGYLQSIDFLTTGMQSIDSCIIRHVREGLIDLEEGLRAATRPSEVKSACADLATER